MNALSEFKRIRQLLCNEPDVAPGKMMSSEAIKCNDKVFAFFHKEMMNVKLGADFDPMDHGIEEWYPLSPFKTKPPLKGWVMVPERYKEEWPRLAELALLKIR